MIKKIIIFLLLTANLIGCKNYSDKKKIDEIVKLYHQSLISMEYEKIYALLSELDKKVITLEKFKEDFTDKPTGTLEEISLIKDLFNAFSFKSTYKTNNLTIDSDNKKAQVIMEYDQININEIGEEVKNKITLMESLSITSSDALKAFVIKAKEIYKDKKIPIIIETNTINLVKENKIWKLYFNYEKQIKIENLFKEAKEIEEKYEFEESIKKCNEILKLDPQDKEARNLKENNEQKVLRNKSVSLENINLVPYRENDYQELRDALSLIIKNNNQKEIAKLEIKFSYLDDKGVPFYHQERTLKFQKMYHEECIIPGEKREVLLEIDKRVLSHSQWNKKVSLTVIDVLFKGEKDSSVSDSIWGF